MRPRVDQVWVLDLAPIAGLCPPGPGRATVHRRIHRGAWQQPLPGVVCRTTGSLTADQWRVAALMYAGPGAALSHETAGEFWGLSRASTSVHVTVPHGRHRRSAATVIVHQSTRALMSRTIEWFQVTPPARTAIDMALAASRQSEVDAILGRVLQREWATVEQLEGELDVAPRRGSRLVRVGLAVAAAGSHAASEARFLRLVLRAGIPPPELNAPVATAAGTRFVDALWRGLGKGVEIDGRGYHLDAASWQADLARQNLIHTAGVVLLRVAAARLWTEPEAVVTELLAFLGPAARAIA